MKDKAITTEIIHQSAPSNAAEVMMQEYMNSMKMMIQAQRDVMLQFLGAASLPPMYQQVAYQQPLPQSAPQSFVQPLPVVPAVAVPQQAASKPAAVHVDVKVVLMKIVSDKTGYPQEMLGMEMDLEADLSIDSIKRMEIIGALRTELGGFASAEDSEDSFMEQLAGIKTLNGLVNWINEHAVAKVSAEVAVVASGAEASQTTVAPAQSAVKFSLADVKSAILSVVSEKTGYPQDMLGMDLDLEADLSIDSIKRMEIIGELKIKIGFSKGEDGGDDLMEKLAAIKTLNGLVSWISEIEQDNFEPVTEAKKIIEEQATVSESLSRLRFELTASRIVNTETSSLKGKRFAVTNDGGLQAAAIKELFEGHGATADIVAVEDQLKGYDGLIILNMFASINKINIIDYIAMIKGLDFEEMKWVYFISDTKGHMTEADDASMLRHFQGYSGLFKSLDKEYDTTKCRIISLTSKLAAADVAGIALNEILNADQPSEIIYDGKKRQTLELIPSQLVAGLQESDVKLEKDAVVLVLGGAQGITSKLITHLAQEYPCRYVLVGRSPDPRTNGLTEFAGMKTKEEIRSFLIKAGQIKKPAEIEQETARIYKNNEILQTIKALEDSGSVVDYTALDLRDEDGLSKFIADVYAAHGRIDGVIHGAGLLEDKLFHSKTLDSFKRVFDTKVTPLRVLAEKMRPETQFVIFFSSIASVYGNRGQTDYAAANSVMDKYAWALKEKIKGKVMAINWGPWKGAGMVSATLEKEYKRRGISLIPLQEGKETFVNELKYGNESQVLIMAGNNW